MGFDLKAASAAVQAAKRDAKQLAAVGVTPKEIAAAGQQLALVIKHRRSVADARGALRDHAAQRHHAKLEAKALIAQVKRRVSMVLAYDTDEDASLKALAGIGGKTNFSARDLSAAAANLAQACGDPRWKKALARRGVSSRDVAQLRELSALLADVGDAPSADGLPAELAEALKRVAYLRTAALTCFGPGSANYAPYRAPQRGRAKAGKAPATPPAA